MTKRTLYKLDSKGKERVLHMWVEGSQLIQEGGLLNGKLVKNIRQCHAKNAGKSNSTTPEQQAVKELESKYKQKIDEGYSETLEAAKTDASIYPMLAKSMKDHRKKIDWNLTWVQPKLDGMRCLLIIKDGVVTMMSRKGKAIETAPHIIEGVTDLPLGNMILDGELYAHGLSFQENMKLTKKYRGQESHLIKFHVYDAVLDAPFVTRNEFVVSKKDIFAINDIIQVVETTKVTSEDLLRTYHSHCVSQGYEGTMVRWGDEHYKAGGRSAHLLKNKDFLDLKAKVVDVVSSESRPEEAVLVCEFNGKKFRATPKCSRDIKKLILDNSQSWINQEIEIRYFEMTDSGIPRFPVAYVIFTDDGKPLS